MEVYGGKVDVNGSVWREGGCEWKCMEGRWM